MRRKLAYLLLTGALIVGVGTTIGSAVMSMDTDITYGTGQDIYFRILDHDENRNGLITDIEEDDYVTNDNYQAVNLVAEEMEDRLESWGANAYVRKEGYDTVVVSIRSQDDDSLEYTYLQNYLSFSGGNVTVAAGSTAELTDVPEDDSYLNNAMFEGNTATIEYVDNIPVVAIEVNQPGEDGKMATLIDYCVANTHEGDEEAGTETVNCFLVLWNNYREGDNFTEAYDGTDPNMASRLFFGENAQSAWYDEDNDDDDYTRLQLVPNSEALQDGIYDESKAGAAYKAAFYYMSLLNASSYEDMGVGYDVMYAYSTDIDPTIEALLAANDWHWTVNMSSSTMIATLCALGVAIVILAVFYRMGSLAIIGSAGVSIEGAILLLGYFGSQFNIALLIGLVLGGLVAIFGASYYFSKMREQLYAGRSPKKAHSEAAKKAVWPTIDAGIIAIVLGLCVYYMIPASVGALGISLVWTSAFATIFNLVVLRLEGWLLANSKTTREKYGKYYLVDERKVPDAMSGEKPTYEGPFAEVDFQKHKKPSAIILGLIAIASIVGISAFSIATGTSFNYAGAYEDSTSISIEYRVNSGTSTSLLLSSESDVVDEYLPSVTYFAQGDNTGATLLELADTSSIVAETRTLAVSGGESIAYYDVYYFDVPLTTNIPLDEAEGDTYHFDVKLNDSTTVTVYSLADALETLNMTYGSGVHSYGSLVVVQPGVPSLSQLYLGVGIGYLAITIYLLLRFRSRGFAAGLIGFAASLPALGLFALTRLAVGPTIMLGAIISSLIVTLFALYIMNKEIEINHDSREKDKKALAYRNDCLKKANSYSAHDVLTYALISLAIILVYFGLVPNSYSLIFLGAAFATICGLVAMLILLEPLSLLCSKLSRSIASSIKKSNAKQNGSTPRGQITKKQNAEPEETIFIGIND